MRWLWVAGAVVAIICEDNGKVEQEEKRERRRRRDKGGIILG